jgi:hypothetical protein
VRVSFVFEAFFKALGHLPLYVIFLDVPPKGNTCYFFVTEEWDLRGVIPCFYALQRLLHNKGTGETLSNIFAPDAFASILQGNNF